MDSLSIKAQLMNTAGTPSSTPQWSKLLRSRRFLSLMSNLKEMNPRRWAYG